MSQVQDKAASEVVESFLREAVGLLEPDFGEERRTGPGRPRIMPAMCLWVGLVVGVAQGVSSQLGLWRLLSEEGLWDYPRFALSDQAIYKRLASADSEPLQQLFWAVSQLLRQRLAPYVNNELATFASEVVALDESTLEQMMKHLPTLRSLPKGDPALLGGKIAGLFDIRRQQWSHLAYRTQVRQDEKVAAREMVSHLPEGALVLADLGYFGFKWFDDLQEMGHFYVSRLRQKTSFELIHVFYQQGTTLDAIVWLGKYRADRAAHAVRLVQFEVNGNLHQYITNVRDPYQLSLYEIAYLYHRRWDLELALKMLKRELNLHWLWSGKVAVVEQQVWAALIVAQIMHGLQLEIAGLAGADPFEVSIALLVRYLPRLAKQGKDPIAFFVARGRHAHFIRPSRRTIIVAPFVPPEEIVPLPNNTLLLRQPRYAQRNC